MTSGPKTKCEALHVELTRLLDDGKYTPHQKFFSVEKLKQMYSVSQATVTEVFKRLELEGRIYSRPKSGTYVSPPQKLKQILLVAAMPRIENEELGEFIYYSELGKSNDSIITFVSRDEFLRDLPNLTLIYRNVAGVVFFRTPEVFSASRARLEAAGIVAVFYGSSRHREEIGAGNCYLYDEREVVDTTLNALYDAGHRKIGCAYREEGGIFDHRYREYLRWMREHDLPVDPESVLVNRANERCFDVIMRRNPASFRFTALFCVHYGHNAIPVIQAFQQHGVRVPEDISIATIGSPRYCRFITPQLSILSIDHKGDAADIVSQIAAAVRNPARAITGRSKMILRAGDSIKNIEPTA